MQKVAFEFKFLVIMDTVEDVCGHLEQMLDQLLIIKIRGTGVDGAQHLRVSLKGLVLELLVGIDLITLGLEDPA